MSLLETPPILDKENENIYNIINKSFLLKGVFIMKKFIMILLAASMLLSTACSTVTPPDDTDSTDSTETAIGSETEADSETETDIIEKELDTPVILENCKTVKVDVTATHQTIESFGASGAWWSQDVGGWDKVRDTDGLEIREYIAKLLFDDVEGIGLNSYRYNIGAGSADQGSPSKSGISDVWRRAQSFIDPETGEYDWSRDANAVWFMNKAADLGVDEIIMFCNSPLESLTKNGKAYSSDGLCNISKDNYDEFATYVLDVAEHFVEEGLPIKFVSPINEPQWEWTGGQEGCHYSDSEVVSVLSTFVKAIKERDTLVNAGVEISGPEGVNWHNDNGVINMCNAIMNNKILKNYLTAIDNHSYWSDANAKRTFANTFIKKYPDLKIRMSEWCEMVNGKDTSIDSAINLAIEIQEDMTILDCVSWQYWIAVSCYDYRDGLIYVDKSTQSVTVPKRLWAMGNYSRFIDPGYVRVDAKLKYNNLYTSAYTGINELGQEELVLVLVNNNNSAVNIDFSGIDASKYNRMSVNVTSSNFSLAERFYGEFSETSCVELPKRSVVTVVISNVD